MLKCNRIEEVDAHRKGNHRSQYKVANILLDKLVGNMLDRKGNTRQRRDENSSNTATGSDAYHHFDQHGRKLEPAMDMIGDHCTDTRTGTLGTDHKTTGEGKCRADDLEKKCL